MIKCNVVLIFFNFFLFTLGHLRGEINISFSFENKNSIFISIDKNKYNSVIEQFYFYPSSIRDTTTFFDSYNTKNIEEAYCNFIYLDILKSKIVTLFYNDIFYLPLIEILKLLEINFNINFAERKIEGFIFTEDSTYRFDFSKLIYEDKLKSFQISNNDFIVTPLEVYVTPDLLYKAFGFVLETNLSELTIQLHTQKNLPVYNRVKREISYRYISKEIIIPDYVYYSNEKMLNGFLFDYFISSNFSKGVAPFFNYNFGLGSNILNGSFELNVSGSVNQKYYTLNDYTYRCNYVLNNKKITQITIGSIEYDGLQQTTLKGISLTNEPIEPRKNFYNYLISEQCGPNWTVELYINNKLIDVTKADASGNFYFKVPLGYGTTFVQLKYYSPTGKYLLSKRLYRIPIKFLPPCEFNYKFSFGKVNYNNNLLGQLSTTYGFNDWLTFDTGLEFLKDFNKSSIFFYSQLNARVNTSNTFNLLLAPNIYYKFIYNTLFYSQATINFSATKYFKNNFYNPFNLTNDFQFDFFVPLDFAGYSFNLGTNIKFQNSSDLKNKYIALNIGAKTDFFTPTLSYRLFHSKYHKSFFKQSNLQGGLIMPLRLLDKVLRLSRANLLSMQFNYDILKSEFTQYNITYSTELMGENRLEIKYNSIINTDRYLQLGFVINLPVVKTWSNVTNNNIYTNLYGAFSYDFDLRKFLFYNRPQIGKSAIICRLFLDRNLNNKYDAGEKLINEGNVSIDGPCAMEKVEDGIIKIRELNPYTKYIIRVSEDIKNPLLVPTYRTLEFQTKENSSSLIDIPFYEAVEIYGNITLSMNDGIKKSLNGIKVIIENLEENYKQTLTTYTDGTFYYHNLKPARYKIYLDPEQLNVMKAFSIPEFVIKDFRISENMFEEINFELKIVNN